jgi:hypothetical protein
VLTRKTDPNAKAEEQGTKNAKQNVTGGEPTVHADDTAVFSDLSAVEGTRWPAALSGRRNPADENVCGHGRIAVDRAPACASSAGTRSPASNHWRIVTRDLRD